MGQNSSLPKGRRKSLRSFVRRPSKKHSISHTFNLNYYDDRVELLNINIATEEELMTLPCVNREIAKNIVEHRKAIGRFRRIEDLALVSGIGAEKLELIRPEICVSMRRSQSSTSSRAPSYDSLKSTDSRVTSKSNRLVNINRASAFELQSVPGINQEIAAAIVHYRQKKGNYQKIDDLIRVKKMTRLRLDNISHYLTVEDTDISENGNSDTQVIPPRSSILSNGYTLSSCNGIRNDSLKLSINNGMSLSSLIDIFELLSTYSPRPTKQDEFSFNRNGEKAIRIASWNLHNFSFDKATNLGVREVVCRTILENGWSVLAVQDVHHVTALKVICDELNKPKLQRVDEWKNNSRNWNFCMLDVHDTKLGFIYDSDSAFNVELLSLNEGPRDAKNDCEVLISTFNISETTFRFVNVRLHKNCNVKNLNEKFKEFKNDEDMLMVFLDLSNIKDVSDEHLTMGDLNPVFPKTTTTGSIIAKGEYSQPHISNILHSDRMKGQLTGHKGLVQQGLTHLAIPNGWSWGGTVSPCCPVWVELYVNSCSSTTL